jgi:NifB/MoaA-like Fe-S oxidoreductase
MGVTDELMVPFAKRLEQAGITDSYLVKKLKAELEANDIKLFAHEGIARDKQEVPAWLIRQKARQDAHKLRGDYPAEKHELAGVGGEPLIPPENEEHRNLLKEIAKEIAERRIRSDRRAPKKR